MRPMVGCAVLLTVLSSAACTTRRSVSLDELNILTPERAWVTWSDQSIVMMWEPKVVRDSLTGYIGRHREKLPTAGVTNVSVQTAARTRTALLVAGITLGMTGFFVLAGGSGPSAVIVSTTGPPGYCDIDPEQPICTGVPE